MKNGIKKFHLEDWHWNLLCLSTPIIVVLIFSILEEYQLVGPYLYIVPIVIWTKLFSPIIKNNI